MDNSQRVDDLVAALNRERIAWMWDNELPDNYSTKYYWPFWLRDHNGKRPVILRGSREWRDMTTETRKCAAHDFIMRAARIFRVTADPYKQRKNDVLNRISSHCRKRWPSGRAWEGVVYPQYERWQDGELVNLEENALEGLSLNELYERQSVVRNVARMVRELRRDNVS